MRRTRKLGRPSTAAVADRRRSAVRLLAEAALATEGAVKLLAQGLRVGERAARADLESLAEDPGLGLRACVPEEIRSEFERADTAAAFLDLEKRLWLEHAAGRLSLGDARTLMAGCRELRRRCSGRSERRVEERASSADPDLWRNVDFDAIDVPDLNHRTSAKRHAADEAGELS